MNNIKEHSQVVSAEGFGPLDAKDSNPFAPKSPFNLMARIFALSRQAYGFNSRTEKKCFKLKILKILY
jgi:hypothetical protein